MSSEEIPAEFLARAKSVTAKRAKTVIDHILQHGFITTEQLKETYGYNHPPRAARDVKEQGIPLLMFKTTGSDGRRMAAYKFDLNAVADGMKFGGRKAFPKVVKEALLKRDGCRCAVCGLKFESRYLQVDHSVPYEVAGESLSDELSELMLLDGSCNRAKSWSCENCENWKKLKKVAACRSCYWANPTNYTHIALVDIRRVDVAWVGDEVKAYDKLRKASVRQNVPVAELVKSIIKDSNLK